VVLAKQRFNLRERDLQSLQATFVPFTAQTRMSGINIDRRMIRKGSVDAIRRHVEANGGHFPADVDKQVEDVARQGRHRWWSRKANACWGYFAERYR
jgi:K+-transporting ATPase ATPase B chain